MYSEKVLKNLPFFYLLRQIKLGERSRVPYVTKIDMIGIVHIFWEGHKGFKESPNFFINVTSNKIDMMEGTEKDLHFHSYFSKVHVFWEGHKGFKESTKFFPYLLSNVPEKDIHFRDATGFSNPGGLAVLWWAKSAPPRL